MRGCRMCVVFGDLRNGFCVLPGKENILIRLGYRKVGAPIPVTSPMPVHTGHGNFHPKNRLLDSSLAPPHC